MGFSDWDFLTSSVDCPCRLWGVLVMACIYGGCILEVAMAHPRTPPISGSPKPKRQGPSRSFMMESLVDTERGSGIVGKGVLR